MTLRLNTLLLALPAVAALLGIALPEAWARRVATALSVAAAAVAIALCWLYDWSGPALQFEEHYLLLPALGISYHFGVEPMGLLAVVLAAVVNLAVVLFDQAGKPSASHLFFTAGAMCVLTAREPVLANVGWVVVCAALCWMAARTPGARFVTVTITLAGAAAIVAPPLNLLIPAAGLILVGFVSGPVRLAAARGPVSLAAFAAPVAVAPALAIHGMFATQAIQSPVLVPLAVAVTVLFALLILRQRQFGAALTCLAASYSGWMLLGWSLHGAVRLAVAYGAAAAMLLAVADVFQSRRPDAATDDFNGLTQVAPRFAAAFTIAIACAAGMPLVGGFFELAAILNAAGEPHWRALLAAAWLATISALAILFQRTMLGDVLDSANLEFTDLSNRERLAFVPLVIVALVAASLPAPWSGATKEHNPVIERKIQKEQDIRPLRKSK